MSIANTTTEVIPYLQANGQTLSNASLSLISIMQPMVESTIEKFVGFAVGYQTGIVEYLPETTGIGFGDTESLIAGYEKIASQIVALTKGSRSLSILQLRNTPVRSIESVYENPAAWYGGDPNGTFPTVLAPGNYYLDCPTPGISFTGHLYKTTGVWSSEARSVKVTYSSGFQSSEINTTYSGIKLAVMMQMSDSWGQAVRRSFISQYGAPVNSVSIEDFSINFAQQQNLNGLYSLSPDVKQILEPYINYSRYFGR